MRPRPEERQAWLDIFDKYHTAEDDSSDGERTQAEARAFLRNESDAALDFEDKICVVKGDLQGAIGVIKNFDLGGNRISFKSTNLEGFDDELQIERADCVKYFDLGDAVQIVDGKYKGECAMVMNVD